MAYGLPDMTLQSTRHELILHGLQEVTSERQIISHDPSVTSMVLMVQNGRKYITYMYYNKTIVDLYFGRHGLLLNSKLNQIDLCSVSVIMTFTVQ